MYQVLASVSPNGLISLSDRARTPIHLFHLARYLNLLLQHVNNLHQYAKYLNNIMIVER